MANAIAVGSACVCAPGTHASGGACRFDAILSLSSPSTTVTEGGVAAWTLTLLQPQALTSSVVIDVIVTVSPGGLVTHSLIQFGRGRTSPQAMQVPVLRDGNADVTQRVNVSTALSGSSGTDPSFADPLVLPSILFLVLNADTCPLGQYWSGGGCVCVGANTALLAGVCGCANGYVSCGGMCVLASPLSLSAASVTVIEGASVNLSVSLAGSISDSSCVVAVSVTWLSGPARLTATPAGLVWAAGNATVPANITIALPRDGIVTGNATAVLSVAVSSSCGAFAPRVPVTVAVLAVDGDVPALLPSVPLLTLTDATGVLTLTLASGCVCDTSVAVSLSPPLSFLGVNTSQLDAAPFGSGDYFVPRVLTLFRRGSAPVDISSSTLTLTTVCASTGTAYPAAASVALTVYAYPVSLTLTPTQSPLVLWEGTTSTLTLALTHTPATPVSVSCAAVGGGVTVSVSPPSFLLNTTAPVGVNVTLLPDGLVTGNATLSLQCVCNDSGIVPPAPLLLLCVDADTAAISVDVADGASLAQGTTLYARVSLTPTLRGGVTLLMTVAGAGVSATFPNGLTVYTLPPLPAPWSPSLPFALTSSDADVWFGNRNVTVTITVLSAPADVAFTGLTVSRSLACVGPSPLLLLSVGPGVTQGANASLVIAASPSLRAYQYALVTLVCSSPLLRLSAASVVLNATWPSQSVSVWVAWSAGSAPLVITCVGTVAPSFSSTNAPAYFNASGSVTFTAAAATAAAAPGVLWDAALTGPLGGAIAGQAISVTITVYTPLTAPILFVWATNNAALPAGPPPQSTTVRVSAPPDTVCRGSRISTFTFSTLSSESAYAGLTRALSFTSRDQGTPGWYWGTGSVSVTAGGLGVNALLYLSCQYPFPVNLSIAPTPSLLFAVSPSLSALPALSSTPLVFSVIPAAASLPFPSSFLSAAVQLSLSGAPAGWPSPPPLPVSVSTPITASVLLSTIVGSVSEALLTQAAVVQVTLTAPVYAGDVTLGAVANATVTVTAVYASGHCIPSDVTQTVLLSLACNSDADCPTGGMTCMQHTKVIVSPPSLTFTSANWALGQSFHITPENDSVVEGPHFSLVTLIVSSFAVGYTNITLPRPVNISITDNDVAGVSVVTSGALPFKLYEPLTAGAPNSTLVTYVKLSGQPNRAITINITSSSPLLLAPVPSLLLFTPANWALPQPVALTALRDGVVQALSTRVNVSYAIALTPGVDAAFAAVARSASLPIVLTGSVIDADTASVVMSPLGLVLPGGMACVSALPATVSDAQCTSVCISSPAQCPSSLCDCVTNTSPVPSLLLSTSLVSASFTVTLTSTPLFPVTLSLLSSTATAINTTVDPCVGTASGVSVSWPQLLFTPPVVTFPANTTPVAMTVRVSGFPNGVPMGLVTATSRVSVSSHDPAYNITPGASLCPAGVVYGPSNSQGQCPPPPLPSLPFLLNTTLRPVPTLASATLDAAAGVSTLTFSAPVDSVGDVPCDAALAVDADIVPGACRSPLAVVTAAALGTGAVCAYVHTASGASVLRVQLGAGATLAPGMYVSVLPGLHASATDARTVVGRVSVQALLPSDPLTVSVYGATLIDACAGVALTALPSFPSPLVTVTWDILSLTTTAGPLPLPAALASAFPSSSSLLVL
ncbi:MAG: hypothetical protein P4L40_02280, partial [Terracidiphilus sp.]|nr:hypothetical protein [Terracidiphilus sp.]